MTSIVKSMQISVLQAFQLILNAGLASGDWECTDGYWRLPKQTEIPQQVSPLDIEVDYLLNTARCFTDPSEKDRLKLNSEKYFEHQNYHPKTATLRTMFDDNLAGYQIVPGKFVRDDDGAIKRKACWQSQQVFMVEFDDNVKEISLARSYTKQAFYTC